MVETATPLRAATSPTDSSLSTCSGPILGIKTALDLK
jgi:hypothetical protein